MREHLDGDVLYANLMMMRQVDTRVAILVEGEEDIAIIDAYLNTDECRSEIGHGKSNVLRAAQLAQANNMDDVFAAVDRDFDDHASITEFANRISISKYYDLQVDVLMTCEDVSRRILAAHADRLRVAEYANRRSQTILSIITTIGGHVGALRQASMDQNLGLSLSQFPTAIFIEAYENGNLIEHIATVAASKSKSSELSKFELSLILNEAVNSVVFEDVCAGHDLINLMSALVRTRLGGSAGSMALGRAIRSAVDWECFQRLRICEDFRLWGDEVGHKVWARDRVA